MFDFGLYTQVSDSGPHGPLVKIKSKKWFVTLADWERVLVLSLLMGSLLTFNWIIRLRIIYHNWIITPTRSTPHQTGVVLVSVP